MKKAHAKPDDEDEDTFSHDGNLSLEGSMGTTRTLNPEHLGRYICEAPQYCVFVNTPLEGQG